MRICLTLGLFLLTALTARADDWPAWMGPKRDNVWRETGVLDSFPAGGPKVLWRAKVANGFSGPAVADGLVVITDFTSKEDLTNDNFDKGKFPGKERVLCLDAKTGDVKWSHDYNVTYNVSYPNGPRCTPNIDAGKVYTLGAMGNLYCFDLKTGKLLWTRDLRKDYGVDAPLWGFAAHPLIDGDRLICIVGGEGSVAVAFNKNTGKEIWKALSSAGPGYSPPVIIESGGARQLLIWHPEAINSLNPETGKVYWSIKQETVNDTSIMMPRVLGDQLFVGGWMHKAALVKLDAKKPAAKVVWKGKRDSAVYPVNNTPHLEDGHIYGVCTDGELRCVDMKTGERVWATFQATAGDKKLDKDEKVQSGTAHLVKHQDRFFIMAETGHLIIAKLSPRGYDEVSRAKLLDPTYAVFGRTVAWSAPAFANRAVYARNDKELICVSLAK